MSTGIEILREGEICYAKPLHRALLRDSRLSFGARGLFCFLWDLPKGWKANSAHLSMMSPQKRDAIRTLINELVKLGAMRSESIRSANGKMAGTRWILIAPDFWAVASPLAARKVDIQSTERRDFRPSDIPKVGNPEHKVHQGEGFAVKGTTNQPDYQMKDLIDAAIWAYLKSGKQIKNEAGLRNSIKSRIYSSPSGPSEEDICAMIEWRKHLKIASENEIKEKMELEAMKDRERKSAEKTEEVERVKIYFESLSDSRQKELLCEFEEYAFSSNPLVFNTFKKKGIKSKVVFAEFSRFIGMCHPEADFLQQSKLIQGGLSPDSP